MTDTSLGPLCPPYVGHSLTLPSYAADRQNRKKLICHIGPGNFHRAHQAVYLHRLLQSGVEKDWGICGIGLMPSDRRLQEALQRQHYVYTVWECDGGPPQGEMIGAICDFIDASDDSRSAVTQLASDNTRIVSLTITEKGYHLLPDGGLNVSDPNIAHDISHPDQPRTAPGLIVAALKIRYKKQLTPFTVMSCDNLLENGHQARKSVCALARHCSAELADWIEREVSFPLSMVDRITPNPDPTISQAIRMAHHLADEALLLCEPWIQWVIEDNFNCGRPAWERVGAVFSNEVQAFEQMKVSLLNGSHSAMAHLGLLLGYDQVHEFCCQPLAETWLQEYMAEVLAVLTLPAGIDGGDYCLGLLARFKNSGIVDQLLRLAEDSPSKFSQCVFPALALRLERGLDSPRLCQAVALWFYFLAQRPTEAQRQYRDPQSAILTAQASQLYQHGGVALNPLRTMLKTLLDWPDTQISVLVTMIHTELQILFKAPSVTAWWHNQFTAI